MLACGLGCALRDSPQVSFQRVQHLLRHGDLVRAQEEAERNYEQLHVASPQWARKFKILEAEAILLRGMFSQALALLNSEPGSQDDTSSVIEILALKSVANARLHNFEESDRDIREAEPLCSSRPDIACGKILRARGILAVQQGRPSEANQYFEQTLAFARLHGDSFLEATALLNLGSGALLQQHFDEAIDWTNAAYRTAEALNAETLVTKALGNLGWAYYNLGDSEKSLELSLEAERRAAQVGDVIDQLSWITNAGYVYADRGDLSRAKQSYSKALDLATAIKGQKDIYNALRALALVSVESGDLAEARKYSDQAISLARSDNNRLDELYPLLVKGLIAAKSHDGVGAERIFHEVDRDPKATPSLHWRSEHALARLHEDEGHPDAAEQDYRAALTTLEAARSSLQRNESKLPFSNNAARIYDDYIHFLAAQKKTNDALRWADYSRARTLKEGLGKGSSIGTAPLNAQQISRRANGAILFYWLGEAQSYLWTITPEETAFSVLPPRSQIEASVQRYGKSLRGPQDARTSSGQLPDPDGLWLYRTLIAPAELLLKKDARVFVIPDGTLNNLNFETLIVDKPEHHFWIEDADVVNASSLRVLEASVVSASSTKKKHPSSMLLIGDSVSPSPEYPELPKAADQIKSVARHFPAAEQRIFTREQATPEAYLDVLPEKFSYIHFVAHGTASRLSPLDSAIVLSKSAAHPDSFKLYARQIVPHTLHANLVTISSCYSAGDRAYSGEGLVGLAWAFLRAGAHNVIAGLWEVTDSSTGELMDRFYGEIEKGASVDVALRAAKLSLLHSNSFRNPFYWAPFQLYTGS